MMYKITVQLQTSSLRCVALFLLLPSFFQEQIINLKKKNQICYSHEYITTDTRNSKIEYFLFHTK